MSTITVGSICDTIADWLDDQIAADDIRVVQTYRELTESIPDTDVPLLQVYPESYDPEMGSGTERTAFKGAIRNQVLTLHIDHYTKQRSDIAEDMRLVVAGLDAVEAALDSVESYPFFGITAIKSFDWSWNRITFRYGNSRYLGGRFVLTLRIS